jgi:hypothetical protein
MEGIAMSAFRPGDAVVVQDSTEFAPPVQGTVHHVASGGGGSFAYVTLPGFSGPLPFDPGEITLAPTYLGGQQIVLANGALFATLCHDGGTPAPPRVPGERQPPGPGVRKAMDLWPARRSSSQPQATRRTRPPAALKRAVGTG